jgi:membrane protein
VRRLVSRAMGSLPGRVIRKFAEDNGPTQAVSIAWNALQSIFPIALVLAAVLGFVLSRVGVQSKAVYQTVVAIIPGQAGQQEVFDGLEKVRQTTGLFAVLGVIGFLWSASLLFGAIEQAFDLIYHVPMRDFLRQKVVAVVMMVIFSVLAAVAIATSALLPLLDRLPGIPVSLASGPAGVVVQFLIGSISGLVLFFVIYYVVPNRKQKPTQVWPGALFSGVALELLSLGFPLYLHFAGQGMNQYGKTFGLLFILMVFFYFVGVIIVLGVEINSVLYPVPIPQPDRVQALSPAATGEGEPPPEIAERRRRREAAAREAAGGPAASRPGGGEARPRGGPVKQVLLGLLAVGIGIFAMRRGRGGTGLS